MDHNTDDLKGKFYEITVKGPDNEELKIKMWWEATIDDWQPVFSAILTWATYHPDNIFDLFHQEKEED